jgi:hypothetical protein
VSRLGSGAVMITTVVILHYRDLIGYIYLLERGCCQDTESTPFANRVLPCVSKLNRLSLGLSQRLHECDFQLPAEVHNG